ncbi:MAG TPA: hypothetical protein VHK67_07210 [Rhabdochlamydiaceae bacterium]|jgi:hypothetical protein|nr:hypothetical protein [Rhabdochlamydiaceae bacterium]
MTSFHITSAAAAVITPFASYRFKHLVPDAHVGFVVVASTIVTYATVAISIFGNEYAKKLTCQYFGKPNADKTFYRLVYFFSISSELLLPNVARLIGQRMGYPVPDYLHTFGYSYLTSTAFWIPKTLFEFGIGIWERYSKPDKNQSADADNVYF